MRQRERRAFLQTLPLAPIAQEAHSQAYRKVGHPPPIMAGSAPAPSSCCQAGIPGRSLPAVGERETMIRINDFFFCAGASGEIHDPILMRFQPPPGRRSAVIQSGRMSASSH